jgi:CHAD domain-containing protein
VTLIASEESIAPLDEELRWLGSVLGPARDLDVFALETLPGIARQFRGQREIARLRARVGRRRRQAARAVREAIASPRFQRLLLALGAFFATLGRTSGIESESTRASDWIVPVLERRHAKLIKRTRRVHRLGPAERHRARVATKKLRYAAEFFAPLFSGKRAEAYGEALAKLQSALGRLNDIEVAGKLVDALAPKDSAKPDVAYASGIVRGWLAGRVDSELKRLRDARRVFARCEPFWE